MKLNKLLGTSENFCTTQEDASRECFALFFNDSSIFILRCPPQILFASGLLNYMKLALGRTEDLFATHFLTLAVSQMMPDG